MKKMIAASVAALSVLLIPVAAHACAPVTVEAAPNFKTVTGTSATFSTYAFDVGNTYMLYVELDPTTSTDQVTEPGVTWTNEGTYEALGKTFSLWHGVANTTGRNSVAVSDGGASTTFELGWQQFGPTTVYRESSLNWSGQSVGFPALGEGYLWEYGKSTSAASCDTSGCTVTPQQNVLLSGGFANYPGGPSEPTQPNSQGFSLGVHLLP